MNQLYKAKGTFTSASTAAAKIVDCGFVPDMVTLYMNEATARKQSKIEWTSDMGAGFVRTIVIPDTATTTGDLSSAWVASGGITVVDTGTISPKAWKLSTVYAVGDIVHPTTNNGYYYQALTAGTSHSAEPTWLTVVAGTTSEGGGAVTWKCFKQADLPVQKVSTKGFTVPAALQEDSAIVYWVAERIDK